MNVTVRAATRAVVLLLTLGLCFSLVPVISFAQELGTAVLNGDVIDPQGAVVRGANVTAENTATGLRRATTTSNAGLFVLNNLAPGKYEVRVEASGFATYVTQMTLEVGQQADLKARLTV